MPELVRLYNESELRLARMLPAQLAASAAAAAHDASPLSQQRVSVQVDGLRCAACGMRLKQALLAQVGGVRRAELHFESGRVELHGHGVSKDDLIGCISGMGYSVRAIEFQEEPPGKAESGL